MEVQILYLVAAITVMHVLSPVIVLFSYLIVQATEIHGMLLIRRIFRAARDPRDTLEQFAGPAVTYEIVSALGIAIAFAIAMLNADPEWQLGVVAAWCIGIVYFVFPTMYCVRSMYGATIVQTVFMALTFCVDYMLSNENAVHLFLANLGLCIFTGATAAFIGRQLRGEYVRGLHREQTLATTVRDLNRQNALKTDFVGHLSHELRTPLNGVMGTAALLRKTLTDPDQHAKLDVMLQSGARLVSMMNDSLDLSRLEEGVVRLDIAAVSVSSLLDEVATLHEASAREKDIDLVCTVEPEMPTLVLADNARVMQCLGNLVTNAIKFSDNGTVRIDAVFHRDSAMPHVQIDVTDQGIGIPPEAQQRIFDPYEQADNSPGRQFQGAGLGLAIARRLAHLMGGDVSVSSVPGEGSTFSLTFVAMPA